MIDWQSLARPSLRGLERYDPGPSRDALRDQHGLPALDPLHWNEDLFGPPAPVLAAAVEAVSKANYYPERAFADFRSALAGQLGVPSACVIPAHGAQALIASIAQVFVGDGTPVVVPRLTYGLYAQVCEGAGGAVTRVDPDGLRLDLDAIAAAAQATAARIVWICDPNNPTGTLIAPEEWERFLAALPAETIVVADEAYIDFADPARRVRREQDVLAGRPVIIIRSFSKIYGLAGLRLGYAVADPEVARLLDVVQEPFNVNRVALAAGVAALADPTFLDRRRSEVAEARAVLEQELAGAGIRALPSQGNFTLVELGRPDVPVCEAVLARGVLIRPGSNFGMPGYARITTAPVPRMREAARVLAEVITSLDEG
ncbi:MAG TPA: histidinol-phosphate transaminase [Gaiellales bacterium]|jgi:histidinol-phosphate aminotransferase